MNQMPEGDLLQSIMTLGFNKKQAEEIMSHKLRPGTVRGLAHIEDVAEVVLKAIYTLDYKSITLKISKHGDEETYDGYIDIEVMVVED